MERDAAEPEFEPPGRVKHAMQQHAMMSEEEAVVAEVEGVAERRDELEAEGLTEEEVCPLS
jgi:hypothetical protein